ncbi:MAG: hypothetical protein ABIZ91_05920 [Gemmatimonadaceae bacterium]
MTRASILSDELVRQLVAVGQVDILVGLPTFNNAGTIETLVQRLHVGLAKFFPRERTVIINADGGSDDGTPDLLRHAPMAEEEMRGSASLRTTHRVSATYAGLPGRAGGVRTVFAAADLLQARAVVLIDPTITSMTPEWLAGLAQPLAKNEADLVLPVHPRGRFEGPLLNQLARPLLSAVYGRRLRSNMAGTFGCSGRFASRMVRHPMWERDLTGPALDVWLVATAMAEDLRLTQSYVGPSVVAPHGARPGLSELFQQVVGTTFLCMEQHANVWKGLAEAFDVPVLGTPHHTDTPDPALDLAPMVERFRTGVRDLAPLLRDIVSPETLARLQAAAQSEASVRVPDPLWAITVYEFAAAAHQGVMNREHLTQALVPLYLGRTASFFAEIASADESAHTQRLAALEREFEGLRPYLVERWNVEGRR